MKTKLQFLNWIEFSHTEFIAIELIQMNQNEIDCTMSSQIESNRIKSNQIELNQIELNQIKLNLTGLDRILRNHSELNGNTPV